MKPVILLLLTTGLFPVAVDAAMSGAYTIDPGQTASANNFQNWYSFWRSLQDSSRSDGGPINSGGVNGAVTVAVKADLTESGMVQFPAITGMSSTNTVTIDGGGYMLSFPGPYEVISFTGGDYFTIKNLTIRQTGTSASSAIGIRFSKASDYNTISSCNIEFSGITTGSTSGSAYIAFANTSTAISTATNLSNGSYNTISGCTMRTTNTNSPGPAFGITLMGNTSNYSSTPVNNTISGNTMQNFYYMAVVNFYTNGNQILSNDISRANATSTNCYTQPILFYTYYTYSTNRSTMIKGNNTHDLPFAGASVSQGMNYLYAFYGWYNYGNATNPFYIEGNTVKNMMCYYYPYVGYLYYNNYMRVTGNTVENVNNYSTSSYWYGWYIYYGSELIFNKNVMQNCTTQYYTYCSYFYNPSGTWTTIEDNVIQDNRFGNYTYAYYMSYANYNVNRNKLINNRITGSAGYIYGFMGEYPYNMKVTNNLVAGNVGYYGVLSFYIYSYNSGNYTAEVRGNTIQGNGASSSYSYHYTYGLYIYLYYHTDIRVTGNIVQIEGGYGAYPIYTYNANGNTAYKEWDHNTYYVQNVSYQYWYAGGSGANDWSAYKASGFGGPNERYGDSKFNNPGANDYRTNVFENQNNHPTPVNNPTDVTGAARNVVKSDRGAFESFMDIKAVSTNFSVPSSVCAGYSVSGGTTLTVQNLYQPDTAYNFNVAYSVNGGPKVSEKVTTKMLYNGTATVTFSKGLVLNQLGNNRIAIFIDIPDDNRTNDSLIFTTFVKPAPGGGKWNFSTSATKALYQYGKPNDVTIVGEKVIYDINPPRKYSNTQYNQNPGWSASVWATTSNGSAVSGATISKNPTGSNDLEYTFVTSNAGLEDSMITLYYKVTDNENGCDTTIKRNVLVYPTINPDFTFPAKICLGDAVAFDNKSSVKSGNMEFEWDFGTGNPNDNTQAPNPVFVFPGTGTYTVKMTAKTLPYGFEVSKTQNVTVSPIPTVKFTKQNACEGQNLVFTNQTTPSNSTYEWNFGDNTTSTAVSPTKQYAVTGQYTVTLKANLNGCIAEVSQRAYQFDRPKADFSLLSGTCDNEAFVFDNKSTIKSGLFGSNWDFNDGTVSTEEEPEHMFATAGQKNVKLTTTSEFGCTNSKTIAITVKESPKADFTNDPACSLTPTDFNNTTPPVSGAVANYNWNFGDGGTSTAESPSHAWSTLGPKTVSFTVTLDNGCEATTSKELFVGVQPNANFDAQNVCAGDPVVFENNTTWAQGDISYEWNFGDNTTSTNSDPQKAYNVTATTTYNVTLKASIAGGCSDEVTKQVTVNEGPTTCDFVANPDYAFGFHGMKTEPVNGQGTVGPQTGVEYTWIADGGGTQKRNTGQFDFQNDGSYTITMRAKVLGTGCICTQTKTVVMNRTSAKELETAGVTVYPNPNSGVFNVALTESFGSAVTIELTSLTGAVIKTVSTTNSGLVTVDAGNVADGMYIVRVSSGDRVSATRINIHR